MINVKNLVLGIGIVIVFGLLLWQGIEAFYPSPDWEDYCSDMNGKFVNSQEVCIAGGGRWTPYDNSAPKPVDETGRIATGYCDLYYNCQKEYDKARDAYSSVVFIVSLIVGVIALFVGFAILSIEPVGSALMGSGIWAIFWGTAINWRNISSIWRFILLLIAFVLLVWIALRINTIKKKGFWEKLGLKK